MNEKELEQLKAALNLVSEPYRGKMEALAKGLTAVFQEAQSQMRVQLAELQSSVQPEIDAVLRIDWAKLRAQMEQSNDRLANLGWTLPMSFAPAELIELAEHGNTDDEIEKFMVDYFTAENGQFFIELRNGVLSSSNLLGWRRLLEQCFEAYDRGHYLVIIPALLSVVEGAVAETAGKIKSGRVEPNKFAADLEKASTVGSMNFLVWRSVRMVLDKLCASSHFGGPNPGELNRHWVLHGRDQTQWTRTDALRLFNLLATIS